MKTKFAIECEQSQAANHARFVVNKAIEAQLQAKHGATSVYLNRVKGHAEVWLSGKVDGGKYYPKLNETCLEVPIPPLQFKGCDVIGVTAIG